MRVKPTASGVVLGLVAIAAIVIGFRIGATDLIGFGAAFLVLLIIVFFAVASKRRSRRTVVTREVTGQLVCHQPSTVTTTIAGLPSGAFGRLGYLRDQLPDFPVLSHRLSHRDNVIKLEYTITPNQPGHFKLGPTASKLTDPFRMASASHWLGKSNEVVVWPKTVPLNVGGVAALSTKQSGFLPSSAADDATLREYVPGDDLRRIHWQTSARRGRPMVRAAEGTTAAPVQ
jgi:uncharacterized protein (DUF58 family)